MIASPTKWKEVSEPAGDLIPVQDRKSPFSAGGAPEENKPV